MNVYFRVSLLCASLVLAGCVNLKPTANTVDLFTLGPVESSKETLSKDGVELIYVAQPDIPSYLSGTRIYWRSLDGRLSSLTSARWAETLEDGLARTIAQYMSRSESVGNAAHYPWPYMSRSIPKLNVSFEEISAYADRSVRVVAHWQLNLEGQVVHSGTFSSLQEVWTVGDAASLVEAMNRALRELCLEIASELDV